MEHALYLAVKVLHIMLAAVAIGANVTYGVWFARANAAPSCAPLALRGIKFIDDYIANPCYVLLLPSGAAMVWIAGLGFGTRWVSWAMGLWLVAILLAYLAYTPTLSRQIATVQARGIEDALAQSLGRRGMAIAALLAVLVFAILVLMVTKPQ
jgi:uncharacterized membrane protein